MVEHINPFKSNNDVNILGRIPSANTSHGCDIGTEFAGRRADTGQRVMGIVENRAFATNINANIDWLIPIPDQWSMSDAVTILTTYSTLWYGLIKRGELQKGLFPNSKQWLSIKN